MKKESSKLKTLEQFKVEYYGKRGTPEGDKLERGFEDFKSKALLQQHAEFPLKTNG